MSVFDYLNNDIDAILVTSDVNRRYLSGFMSSYGFFIESRNKKYLLVDSRYFESAEKNADDCEIILLQQTKKQLTEIFDNLQVKTIAIEGGTLTLEDYDCFCRDFPNIKFETRSLSKALNTLRSVKSKNEIENIIKAQRIAEKAFEQILTEIKVGDTESQIAARLDYLMKIYGSEGLSFETIVLSGKNTSMPHGVPSDKQIEYGDFLQFDFGAVYNGYHSDMSRVVAIGDVSNEMKKVYNIVLASQNKAIEAASDSITGKQLDAVARDCIAENGYGEYFGHSLGHGVGLEIHEAPNTSPNSDSLLPCNTVVTIEPGIYLPGKFGVRIEDMIVINGDTAINLTKTPKNLIKL